MCFRDCGSDESTTASHTHTQADYIHIGKRKRERESVRELRWEGHGRGSDSHVLMFSEKVGSGMAFFRKLRMDFMSAALSGIHVYSTPELNGLINSGCTTEGVAPEALPPAASVVSMATAGAPAPVVSMATTDVDVGSSAEPTLLAPPPPTLPSLVVPPSAVADDAAGEEEDEKMVEGRRKGTSFRH